MYVNPLHRPTDRDTVFALMASHRLEDKLEASQDEAMPDRLGTVRGLRERPCDASLALAALVQDAIDAHAKRHR